MVSLHIKPENKEIAEFYRNNRKNYDDDLGVDLFLIEPFENLEQMKRATKEVDIPLALAIVEGGKTPLVSVGEAEEMGCKVVAFPGGTDDESEEVSMVKKSVSYSTNEIPNI